MMTRNASAQPCVPRDSFEHAASLGRSLLGPPPLIRRGGRSCARELAYGTANWPLNVIVAYAGGFYGTAEAMLRERTLVDYCKFQIAPEHRPWLDAYALDGTGFYRPSPMMPWLVAELRKPSACPLCDMEAWILRGLVADYWPHMAPLVSACWRHGVALVDRRLVQGEVRESRPNIASDAQVHYAQNVLLLRELARDMRDAAHHFAQHLNEAGYCHANGEYRVGRFSQSLQRYAQAQFGGHPICKAMAALSSTRAILRWIRAEGNATVHPAMMVVVLGFLQSDALPVGLASQSTHPHRRDREGWQGRYRNPRLVINDQRTFDKDDIERLLRRGVPCAQVAEFCKVSTSTVWRVVKERNLRQCIRALQLERCRKEARDAWTRARKRFPAASRNHLRKQESRAYKWLQKHDREWMETQPSEYLPPAGWSRSAIPTAEASVLLVSRLCNAIELVRSQHPAGRCSISALCRALSITRYMLLTWAQASAEVAALLADEMDQPIQARFFWRDT